MRRPGYAHAVEIARSLGYEPHIRLAGGHAAAFLESSLAFAWASADRDAHLHIKPRFERLVGWFVQALRALDLDARIGPVPGEYCPGEFSINIAGRIKVMGVGQRVVRGGAHVGGVLTIAQTTELREVLIPVYKALGLVFEPSTAGGIADFNPRLTRESVIDALSEVLRADGYALEASQFSPSIQSSAQALLPLHSPHRKVGAAAALRPSQLRAGGKAIVHGGPSHPTPDGPEPDDS